MKKIMFKYVALFLLLGVVAANGQEFKSTADFQLIKRGQNWVESNNPAGLVFNNFDNISYVSASYTKGNGGFVKYYESDDYYKFGVISESFTSFKKVSVYGKMGYNTFRGENMAWSGLISPEKFLTNIADEVRAQKRSEDYFMAGGISFPVAPKLRGGLFVDYTASNLAKMRDLRHKNNSMNLNAKFSLLYTLEKFNIGLSYWYERDYDQVKYSKISDDASIFYGYNFKGLFFGLKDAWNVDALHLSITSDAGDGLPFKNDYNGAALQLEYTTDKIKFFNEFTYRGLKGSVGIGEELAYSSCSGDIFEYSGKLNIEGDNVNNAIRVKTLYNDSKSAERVFTSNIINGETVVVQYGEYETINKREFVIKGEYELSLGKDKFSPSWNFLLGYENFSRSSVSSMVLPYYYSQKINYNRFSIDAKKNFKFKGGMVDIKAGLCYAKGDGDKLVEHISPKYANVEINTKPFYAENLLNAEYEYYTTPKAEIMGGVRYSYFINKKNNKGGNIFAEINYKYLNANDAIYALGKNAKVLFLSIGVNF